MKNFLFIVTSLFLNAYAQPGSQQNYIDFLPDSQIPRDVRQSMNALLEKKCEPMILTMGEFYEISTEVETHEIDQGQIDYTYTTTLGIASEYATMEDRVVIRTEDLEISNPLFGPNVISELVSSTNDLCY